jgi:hypothetical protein
MYLFHKSKISYILERREYNIANYTLYVYHLKVQTHMASQKATAYLSACDGRLEEQ